MRAQLIVIGVILLIFFAVMFIVATVSMGVCLASFLMAGGMTGLLAFILLINLKNDRGDKDWPFAVNKCRPTFRPSDKNR